MREFTEEEAKAYSKALDKMYKPTGFNVFNEPCDDVVSRQAVLKIIDGWYEQNRDTENIEDLIVLITYMDSVRPQEQAGHWIPTSEMLPNKRRWVLVTTESYQKPVEIMCYQGRQIGQHNVGNGWGKYGFPSWTSGHGDIQSHHPKAWMPLPEPYKVDPQERSDKE